MTTNIIKEELKPQEYLSPSSINTYCKCPFMYYMQYIQKIKVKKNIHLVKGSIVHSVLENFYRTYNHNMEDYMIDLLNKAIVHYEKDIKEIELTDEEISAMYTDCVKMCNAYLVKLKSKMDMLMQNNKAQNYRHAFYLLKPKFREKFVKNEDLHCLGYIDRVSRDFDGQLIITDYKTSMRYGQGISIDYKRQNAIYSLLYSLEEKETPDLVTNDFLRFGEECILEVTPHLLKFGRDCITDTYQKTRSIISSDYPRNEGNHCKWCQFKDVCSEHEDWEKDIRQSKMKQLLVKKEETSIKTE